MSFARIVEILKTITSHSPIELMNDTGAYIAYRDGKKTPMLGEGSSGMVVQYKWNGRTVAAKLYGGFTATEDEMAKHREVAKQEIDALIPFNHSYFIVNLLAYCQSPRPCLFFEKMDYSLSFIMYKMSVGALDKEKCFQILCDINHGIIEVHNSGRLHGDIKPANILIRNSRAKLGDFQCSRLEEKMNEDLNVTYIYAAPEHFTGEFPITKKVDLYGFGITFLEMMCYIEFNPDFFEVLTSQINFKDARNQTKNGNYHRTLLSGLPELIEKCMTWNAKDRPTAEELQQPLQDILTTSKRGLFSSTVQSIKDKSIKSNDWMSKILKI